MGGSRILPRHFFSIEVQGSFSSGHASFNQTRLPSRDMLQIEDMNEAALPPSTDPNTHISQPEKSIQVGVAASRSIIRAALQNEGQAQTSRGVCLIVDLTCHTCDFTRGFLHERGTNPVYYMGFTRNSGELEWSKCLLRDYIAEGFLSGSLTLPASLTLPPADVPADMREAAPPLPALNSFVVAKNIKIDGLPTLKTPDKLLATWSDHVRFRSEFAEFLKDARELVPLDVPADKAGAGSKREPEELPFVKRQKKEEESGNITAGLDNCVAQPVVPVQEGVPLSELPAALGESELILGRGKKAPKVFVLITVGERIWIVNHNAEPISLDSGTTIAGFYKGTWFQRKEQDKEKQPIKDNDILYQLADASTQVQISSKVLVLGSVMKERRKVQPDATISYHTVKDAPSATDPAFFQCDLKHHVYWSVQAIPEGCKTSVKDD